MMQLGSMFINNCNDTLHVSDAICPYRILAAEKLDHIKTSSSHRNDDPKRQTYILRNINNKLRKEDAMIARADKGKSCVIIYNKDYTNIYALIASSYTATDSPIHKLSVQNSIANIIIVTQTL
jgi:hypothetical protein